MAVVAHPHVEETTYGCMIVGTKVPVRRLWYWHSRGITFATLMKRYPTIAPAKILSALAFGHDNRDLIEKELQVDADREAEREMQQLELPCPRRRK